MVGLWLWGTSEWGLSMPLFSVSQHGRRGSGPAVILGA